MEQKIISVENLKHYNDKLIKIINDSDDLIHADIEEIQYILNGDEENDGIIDRLESVENSEAELTKLVNKNASDILLLAESQNSMLTIVQTLVGDIDTVGSIDYKIASAIEWKDINYE